MKFTKMHGIGNDYIYFDCTKKELSNPSETAKQLSSRHFSVGADGIVMILPSILSDFKMRMFNADGTEAEMCGNAIRCVGKYVYEKGLTKKRFLNIETKAGTKKLELIVENQIVEAVRVDMGRAITDPFLIPVDEEKNNFIISTTNYEVEVFAVSMGNPHAVIFVDNIHFEDFYELGKEIESHPKFPRKTNVEFVKILNREKIEMRVFERGTGETLACGTGAVASFFAAYKKGFLNNNAIVSLKGGDLFIEISDDGRLFMTGGATFSFEGETYDDPSEM